MALYELSEREFDTVLAALRFWQRGMRSNMIGDEIEIAENGRTGDDASLMREEIDDLCEGINLSLRTPALPAIDQVAILIEECGGYWSEHEGYTVADWSWEASENNTRAGYWDWVSSQIEMEDNGGEG